MNDTFLRVLILVLVFKPTGLLGKSEQEPSPCVWQGVGSRASRPAEADNLSASVG